MLSLLYHPQHTHHPGTAIYLWTEEPSWKVVIIKGKSRVRHYF